MNLKSRIKAFRKYSVHQGKIIEKNFRTIFHSTWVHMTRQYQTCSQTELVLWKSIQQIVNGVCRFCCHRYQQCRSQHSQWIMYLKLEYYFYDTHTQGVGRKKKICNFLLPPNRPSQLFYNVIDLLLHYQMHGYIKAQLQVAVGYQKFKFSHFYT